MMLTQRGQLLLTATLLGTTMELCAAVKASHETNHSATSAPLMRVQVDSSGAVQQQPAAKAPSSLLEVGANASLGAGDGSASALQSVLMSALEVQTNGAAEEQSSLEARFRSNAQELSQIHRTHVSEMSYLQMQRMYELEDSINRAGKRWDPDSEQLYTWDEFKAAHPYEHSWDVEVFWEQLKPVDKMAKAAAKIRQVQE
mmetsp:Transcript_47892/g.113818  ORF Transcript_47892/g.113818 Transcript_47892/m.113818 type:complete len:200 (-) Transcript_47892:78-677(-)|eukprot:CAMPEP_0178439228 /NCGR_PEP_ID=MMETSP0689_2-20121128/36043_1 /TAXON_ID=160604 /ORGANISM="Amphidinium massartii, Strain CS-259" /LENGTH=199 /DNA_ID=CAMNT_0020061741 /DNA_START=19 /DNA_END=618 /DNA_ORIENTATION=-